MTALASSGESLTPAQIEVKSGDNRMNTRRRQCRYLGALCIGQSLIFGLALSRSPAAQTQAKADDGWVGQRVVQTVAKLTLRMNDEPLESNDTHSDFTRWSKSMGRRFWSRLKGKQEAAGPVHPI